VRIATGFDEDPHGIGRFRLAQQHAVHAPAEDLAELPGIVPDVDLVCAVDRCFDDHRRRAVPGPGGTAFDEAAHVVRKAGHVERAVFHANIDVVRPGLRVLASLRMGQHMAGVMAGVVDRLSLPEQLDASVDAVRHNVSSLWGGLGPGRGRHRR
jgi:hypothetical protein